MKTRKIGILGMALAVGLVFAAMPELAAASEGTPYDVAITLPGGTTNSLGTSYTVGLVSPANSALRPLAVSWACAGLSDTNTITLGKAVGGAAWKSTTVSGTTAASGVTLITDEWYWRRGDTVAVSASVTNAMVVTIHCLEK